MIVRFARPDFFRRLTKIEEKKVKSQITPAETNGGGITNGPGYRTPEKPPVRL